MGLGIINSFLRRLNIPVEESYTGAVVTPKRVALVDLAPCADGYKLNGFGRIVFNGPSPSGNRREAKAINAICRKNGMYAKTVTCLAPSGEMFVRQLRMPRMDRREMINSVRFSERESSSFPLDAASIDVWMEPGKTTSRNVNTLIAALDGTGINSMKKLFGHTRLKHTAISIAPAALAAIIKESKTIDKSKPVPIIDIGESSSGIYVFANGYVNFLREIKIGSGEIAILTAPGFNASKKEADEICHTGINLREKGKAGLTHEMTLKKLKPLLDKMVGEFGRSLEYFKNRQRIDKIPAVHLIGSGASQKNLAAYLSSVMEYDFKVYNPFDDFIKIEKNHLKCARDIGPELVIPLGLAIDRGRTINLLPERFRYSFNKFKGRAAPLAVTAAYLIFLAWLKFTGVHYLGDVQSRVSGAKRITSGLKKEQEATVFLVNEIFNVKSEIKNVEERIRFYPEIKGNNVRWPAVFLEIARHLPGDAALDKITVSFNNQREYAADGKLYGKQLLINGKIRGTADKKLKSLRTYLEKIHSSTLFEHASLISTKQGDPAGGSSSMLLFTLAADIRYPQ